MLVGDGVDLDAGPSVADEVDDVSGVPTAIADQPVGDVLGRIEQRGDRGRASGVGARGAPITLQQLVDERVRVFVRAGSGVRGIEVDDVGVLSGQEVDGVELRGRPGARKDPAVDVLRDAR